MISEERREEIRAGLEKSLGVAVRKKPIKSIGVNPRQRSIPKMIIEVGKKYRDLEPGSPEEEVIAIFESTLFCVCTVSRGTGGSLPYFFLREDVFSVKELG
jgi:hypothetical protein